MTCSMLSPIIDSPAVIRYGRECLSRSGPKRRRVGAEVGIGLLRGWDGASCADREMGAEAQVREAVGAPAYGRAQGGRQAGPAGETRRCCLSGTRLRAPRSR